MIHNGKIHATDWGNACHLFKHVILKNASLSCLSLLLLIFHWETGDKCKSVLLVVNKIATSCLRWSETAWCSAVYVKISPLLLKKKIFRSLLNSFPCQKMMSEYLFAELEKSFPLSVFWNYWPLKEWFYLYNNA